MSGTAVDVDKGTNKEVAHRAGTFLRIKAQESVEKPSPRQPILDAITGSCTLAELKGMHISHPDYIAGP